MKVTVSAAIVTASLFSSAIASEQSKTWLASDAAHEFVEDTIVLGMLAGPYGTGCSDKQQLLDYFQRARNAGVTGHEMTLSAAGMTFNDLITQHHHNQSAMAEEPENFLVVNQTRDIEAAHLQGKAAIIWNSQTTTILDGDLRRMALVADMGIKSMIPAYIDIFRTGSGSLTAFNGREIGLTPYGEDVIDEMVRYGILLDLSHTGRQTAMDAMAYMEETYPGVPFVYTHSIPAGLYKEEPNATLRGCYRNITDQEAIRDASSGGYVSPTFTEWIMDGLWPDDISPAQAADMIDHYVNLLGADHGGIATDDMFDEALILPFVDANPDIYDNDGYMLDGFNKGATGSGEMAKLIPAITNELWARGYTNEDLVKIYGANKMWVWAQVWEGDPQSRFAADYSERERLRDDLRKRFYAR